MTVSEVNDPPIANGELLVTRRDTTTNFRLTTLFANDTPGPDNESRQIISLSSLDYDGQGTVQISATGGIEYTPAPGFVGDEQIIYTLIDDGTTAGANDFQTAQATLTVTVQDNPVAVADEFSALPGATTQLDVLANDDSFANLVSVTSTVNATTQIVNGPGRVHTQRRLHRIRHVLVHGVPGR